MNVTSQENVTTTETMNMTATTSMYELTTSELTSNAGSSLTTSDLTSNAGGLLTMSTRDSNSMTTPGWITTTFSNNTMAAGQTTTDSLFSRTQGLSDTTSTAELPTTTASMLSSTVNKIMTTLSEKMTTPMKLTTRTQSIGDTDSQGTTSEDTMKDFYLSPLVAMAVIACLLFIILVAVVVFWCRKRGQTITKTVHIQPKRFSAPRFTASDVESQQDKEYLELVKHDNGTAVTSESDKDNKNGVDNLTYQTTNDQI